MIQRVVTRTSPSLAALTALVALSCVEEEVRQPAGFSESLQMMYVSSGRDVVWRKVDLSTGVRYSSVILDPLQFHRYHLPWFASVPPATLEGNRRAYLNAMVSALAEGYPFATEARPGTLRISASLTDRVLHPELRDGARRQDPAVDPQGRLPEVGLEVQFRDCGSGELIGVVLSRTPSRLFRANLLQPGGPGVLEQAFRPFADSIRRALDTVVRTQP